MKDYPKEIKRLIREYGDKAYQVEMGTELQKLSDHFDEWKKEKINSDEMGSVIYDFTNGPYKILSKKYSDQVLDTAVAQAVKSGILQKDEMPEELLANLPKIL